MNTVNLCDITTQDGPIIEREAFNITSLLIGRMDGLEYSLGLRRGGLAEYDNRPCTTEHLAKDMADRFSRGEWALMPSEELMKKVCELFQVNHKLATKERIHFIQHLADAEYVYQLLPPVTDENTILYVNGKAYPYPYTDFPPVRTTYHPCFTYPPFREYMAEGYTDKEPNSFRDFDWLIRLILEISRMVGQPINISWFHGTWDEFKSRPTAEVRYDPQPTPPPSDDSDGKEEELLTDDDLSYLEPIHRREHRRLVRYMKAHPHKYDSPQADQVLPESATKAPTGKKPSKRVSHNRSSQNPSSSAAGSARTRVPTPTSLGKKPPPPLPVSERVTRSTNKAPVVAGPKAKRARKGKPPVTPPESDDQSPALPPVTRSSKKRQAAVDVLPAPRAKRSRRAP